MSQPTRTEEAGWSVAPHDAKSWRRGKDVFCDVCGAYIGRRALGDPYLEPHRGNDCLIHLVSELQEAKSRIEDLEGRE